MRRVLRHFIADEGGQDLVEYMLLGTFLALATVVGIQLLGSAMGSSYQSWDQSSQDLWEPPDPVTSGS